MKKKRRVKPERWTAQTLITESRILYAAWAIADQRTALAKQNLRLSRLLVWAAANLKEEVR